MPGAPLPIACWRGELERARQACIDAFLARPRPLPLLRGLSQAADQILAAIWRQLELPAASALVAVGGYGRREMYPHSDVDLLILLDDALPVSDHARFEPLISLFWDVGLPIGHSVRTVSECLSECANDITVQTNLLECRLIAGDPGLYQRFRSATTARLDPRAFFEAKWLEQQNRHGRFADRALLLEPNLKESPGGLRDIQTVFWMAQAIGLPTRLPGLARAGLLADDAVPRLQRHLRLIAEMRIRLHLLAGRREDRLLFDYQERLAAAMGLRAKTGRRASERLMRAYYLAAREISLANAILIGAMRQRLAPSTPAIPLPGSPGLMQAGSLLEIDDPRRFEREPRAIFEVFLALARNPALQALSPGLLQALWRAGRRIDAGFRRDPANWAAFLAILQGGRGITLCLRLLHRLGLLGRYLPAFGRITGQLQHDLVHIYPVDEHTLMLVRNLRRLALPEFAHEFPLAHRLMLDFPRPERLYLAALFHDIAKGRGGDHSILGAEDARRFCRAHGLDAADTEFIAWLVRDHLALSGTAQKQDLADPEVIARFAARCGSVERLTGLYLLTVCDIRATNPKIWNAWKDKLLRELYFATRRALEGGRPIQDSIEAKKEQARASLRLYAFAPGAEAALWARLDEVYFLRHDAEAIAWQTRRLLPLLGREAIIVRARLAPIGEGIEVLVYAPDTRGLFARLCGFFTNMGYSVLEAKIHTTRDGHALDSFLIMNQRGPGVAYRDVLNYIEYELSAALQTQAELPPPRAGRLARQLKHFPIEPEIGLVPNENRQGYLLTLAAGDRPGLLYDIARTLDAHGVGVQSAKIHTLGARAEDVFVVSGESLEEPAARLALEQALLERLRLN